MRSCLPSAAAYADTAVAADAGGGGGVVVVVDDGGVNDGEKTGVEWASSGTPPLPNKSYWLTCRRLSVAGSICPWLELDSRYVDQTRCMTVGERCGRRGGLRKVVARTRGTASRRVRGIGQIPLFNVRQGPFWFSGNPGIMIAQFQNSHLRRCVSALTTIFIALKYGIQASTTIVSCWGHRPQIFKLQGILCDLFRIFLSVADPRLQFGLAG